MILWVVTEWSAWICFWMMMPFVSLVAGMSSIEPENGQMVLAGEPIGLMPDTNEAKLYMEIRKDIYLAYYI